MGREIRELPSATKEEEHAESLSAQTWNSMRTDGEKRADKQTSVEFPNASEIKDGSTTKISVNVEGSPRDIYMHLPTGYDASKPTPLLVVFNGWGDKPGPGGTAAGSAGLEKLTNLSEAADKKGFIVLYMSGNPKKDLSYNNGQYPFSKTDDVAYTTAVLDELNKKYNIDTERISLTGYSQGASFAHKAAAELPEKYRPANLIDVSGWTTGKEKPAPEGMNFLSIQSRGDKTAPFDGRWFGLHMDGEGRTLDRYLQANGVKDARREAELDSKAQGAVENTWKTLTGAKIKSIVLPDYAGHDWHGSPGSAAPINATKELMEFIGNTRRR